MADLQPLGSEKLQGMDKIKRIMEIARFKENIPTPINETSKSEYSLTLADGNEYQIVKEKVGYIIKKTISESVTDYIEPMQNRKYFSSYSQALKRLNLMAREMNELHGNEEGTSLFSEQKKFTLKTPKSEKKNPNAGVTDVENVPLPPAPPAAPAAPAAPEAPSAPAGDDMPPPPPSMDDMGGDDMPPPPPSDMDDMEGEDTGSEEMNPEEHDEIVTFKTIQKLTGKLGQKLRTLNSDEENQMSSKDIKYVINSIISALDMQNLDDEDREDIMNKIEGLEDEFDAEEKFGTDEEGEEEGEDEFGVSSDEEEVPAEMGESWSDLGKDIAIKTMSKGMTPGQFDEQEDDDTTHLQNIADQLFVENKVEDILTKYFTITESEKRFNQELDAQRKIVKKVTKKEINGEVKRLSESIDQEIAARKFLEKNQSAKFIGKTNKKNLVFEMNNKQVKVSPKGNIL